MFFDLEDPQYLQYFKYADPETGKKIESHLTGWQKIHVTNPEHPYMNTGGCRAARSATSTRSSTRLADFLDGLGDRQAGAARLPQRPAHAEGVRRGAGQRQERQVGGD